MIQKKTLNDCAKKTFVSLISQLAKLRDRELELPTIFALKQLCLMLPISTREHFILELVRQL